MRIRHKFLLVILIMVFLINFIYDNRSESVFNNTSKIIVIDPGHGGRDGGKVGVNNALEKDINLEISFILKEYLEKDGYHVTMTRKEDVGLYRETTDNKKAEDLSNRVKIIDETNPAVAVSIHQNSFTDGSCKGAQVFYYKNSTEGEKLAELIMTSLKENVDSENKRMIKANDSYFLLKNTKPPTVIVECGFLSNAYECELLSSARYQDQMAFGIYLGIKAYLNE